MPNRTPGRHVATFANVLAGALIVFTAAAGAKPGRAGEGSVRSCSHYGNGCRVAQVRAGRNGPEYLSPGGNWIECRLDCREAVREDVIDFWETLRERSSDGGR